MNDPEKERTLVKMMLDMGLDNEDLREKGMDMMIENDGENLS